MTRNTCIAEPLEARGIMLLPRGRGYNIMRQAGTLHIHFTFWYCTNYCFCFFFFPLITPGDFTDKVCEFCINCFFGLSRISLCFLDPKRHIVTQLIVFSEPVDGDVTFGDGVSYVELSRAPSIIKGAYASLLGPAKHTS